MSTTKELVALTNRTADEAIDLWHRGEREQAVTALKNAFDTNSGAGADYSWLVGTWELLIGTPAEQVLELLHKHPSYVPEWYFANAITLYKIHGNSPISRAALVATITDAYAIFKKLTGLSDEVIQHGLELEGPHSYPEYGSQLWQETPGAMEWMREHVMKEMNYLDEVPPGAENDPHYRLWLRSIELSHAHIRRRDTNNAKKELLTALKEIARFGLFTLEYETALTSLLALGVSTASQVKSAVLAQFEALKKTRATDRELVIRTFCVVGDRLLGVDAEEEANSAFESASSLLDALLAEAPEAAHYELRATVLQSLADVYFRDSRRSKELLEEALNLQRAYLGPNHGLLVSKMQDLQDCLEELGETAAAQTLQADIDRIEAATDFEF